MSELFIETRGRGAAHLVLLHGWAMSGAVFAPLVERLEQHCTLHRVDLPGHGRSRDSATPLTPDECARAIAQVTPPAIWLGWSLGGVIALQAALDFPQQVQALAMLDSTPRFVRGEDWPYAISPEILQQFAADLRADHHGTLERFLALEALGSDSAQKDLRRLRHGAFSDQPPSVRALCEGLDVLEHTDLRPRLRELGQPSMWIAGRRDRLVPWQAMEWSARECHGGFVRIEGGGHAPFIGHADEVTAALRPLLECDYPNAIASAAR
jgi:pimeloyl-[acyl-carrier protein] methyl ester esterase